MKEAGGSTRPARPWHVIWSPAIPVLALLSGNFGGLMPQAAIRSVVLTVGISVTATLILGRLVRDYQRAALAVSTVILISLSMATAWELSTWLNFPFLPPLLLLWAFLVAGYFLRVSRNIEGFTTFANALSLCTLIFVVWPTAVQQTRRWRQPTVTFGPIDIPAALPDRPRPDIYILILDAYGRADVLREDYHFENTLVPELEKLGFNVPPKAASNYAQTALSLASSLNLEYLPTLLEKQVSVGEPRARLADLISRNRVFDTFTTAGYRIRSYSSEYGLLQPQMVDERPHPTLFMSDFEYGFYEATALPMLFAMAGRPVGTIPFALHRHHIRWTLDVWYLLAFDGRIGSGRSFLADLETHQIISVRDFSVRTG